MKLVKQIALALTVIMSVAATGCATKQTSKEDKEVNLKYIMVGVGKQEDSDKVWAEFNKKLQEKIPNITVDFEIIPASEYKQKYTLMVAGREKVDIVNTYSLNFSEEVQNGAFADMTELIDKYGQDMKKLLPDYIFDYTTVDGKIYAVPTYQMLCVPQSIKTHKELADKYLDTETLKNELNSNARTTQKAYDILDDYMAKLKEAGEIKKGPTSTLLETKGFENIISNYGYFIDDDKCTVKYLYDTDEYKMSREMFKKWKEKGYFRKDLETTDEWNKYTKDGWVMWNGNYEPWFDQTESEKYGFDVLNIPTTDKYFIPMYSSAGSTAILSSCKNKEEAMQVINLIQSDEEMYNLLVYGIEGEHYTKNGDGTITTNTEKEYASSSDKYGLYKWQVGNTKLAYQNQFPPAGYKEWIFDEVNASEYKSPLIGFQIDTTAITDDLTQIDALSGEYKASAQGDDARYEEWMSKVKLAGSDRIISEIQRQVDEFLNNKKE